MLVSIQTSGDKPPFFFIHGIYGVMPLGAIFAQALGPDQPFYAVHANGIDGRKPVIDDFGGMVRAYTAEIEEARPLGPLRIGGMCTGCLLAIEIVRMLQQMDRQTGPVI